MLVCALVQAPPLTRAGGREGRLVSLASDVTATHLSLTPRENWFPVRT